ncbi:ATP-binding protein [Lactococcus lactis]
MIEIFDNRVEISNPGAPINDSNRLMDLPPISRNEELANLFKKCTL